MRNVLEHAKDIVLCGVPFAFAIYLCALPLNQIAPTGLKYWEPAFYSFLPMCFFFVGAATYLGRRELRELRAIVGSLCEEANKRTLHADNIAS